jgi:type 1 glutamine amidotransferase
MPAVRYPGLVRFATLFVAAVWSASSASAAEPKRLLLVGQGPDGHPPATHEFAAGVRIVEHLLQDVPDLETTLVASDEPWTEGPELIAQADGVLLFVSQGAKWVHADPRRLDALVQLAQRRGGLAALHWGIGAQDAQYIEGFLKLLGGCHGGPDRKYTVIETELSIAAPDHPVARGLAGFTAHDEFYYRLKFVPPAGSVTPLVQAAIEGQSETVAWAWDRPDGGRSFGFCGLHFHENWGRPEYRRLVAQGLLWTLDLPIPAEGLAVELPDELLRLESPAE